MQKAASTAQWQQRWSAAWPWRVWCPSTIRSQPKWLGLGWSAGCCAWRGRDERFRWCAGTRGPVVHLQRWRGAWRWRFLRTPLRSLVAPARHADNENRANVSAHLNEVVQMEIRLHKAASLARV